MKITAEAIQSNPWIPTAPTVPQLRFLSLPHFEAFYGGAVGGGKSEALLMAALLFVDEPGYSAILFRRTFSELALDGALMDRAREWLAATSAEFNERDKRWSFPSGATLSFGYLDGPNDFARYQSAEYDFAGFDEATEIRPRDYLRVLTRLRRRKGSRVPLRARAGGNPGGIAHEFFGERFIHPKEPSEHRAFIPALLDDNPYLGTEEYEGVLENLTDVEFRQLRKGEWIRDTGDSIFKPEYFERFDAADPRHRHASVGRFITVDSAYRENDSSDYTAWAIYDLSADYRLKLMEVERKRLEFPALISEIEALAVRHNQDGKLRGVIIEDAGSGTSALQSLRGVADGWLAPYLASFKPGPRKKTERARDAALWARKGCVLLPAPSEAVPWFYDTAEELFGFPHVEHDDRVDAISMGPLYLQHVLAEGVRFRQGMNSEVA